MNSSNRILATAILVFSLASEALGKGPLLRITLQIADSAGKTRTGSQPEN